jgi:cytochrome c-type biogenesis protein CcmE
LLLLAFGIGAFRTVSSALTPYVSFAYAETAGRAVQVKGHAVYGTVMLHDEESFYFTMTDLDGGSARVYHKGALPRNLVEAESVVVVGRYVEGGFVAQRILVKCPSKYRARE